MKQRTISETVSYNGVGLHTGSLTTVTFKPAPADTGIVFYRTDLDAAPAIPALVDNVVDVSRGTTIGIGDVKIHTIEFFHNFCVIRNFKIRYKRIAEPLNFNILTVILTNRNRRINNIRNLHHDFRYLCRKV